MLLVSTFLLYLANHFPNLFAFSTINPSLIDSFEVLEVHHPITFVTEVITILIVKMFSRTTIFSSITCSVYLLYLLIHFRVILLFFPVLKSTSNIDPHSSITLILSSKIEVVSLLNFDC